MGRDEGLGALVSTLAVVSTLSVTISFFATGLSPPAPCVAVVLVRTSVISRSTFLFVSIVLYSNHTAAIHARSCTRQKELSFQDTFSSPRKIK